MESSLSTEKAPLTPTEWKNFGNKQFVLKRYSKAIKSYSNGISLSDSEDLDLLSNRAAAYINLDHFKQALQDTDRVLKVQPNHEKAIYRRAKALCGLSRCEEAISFLKSHIKKSNKPSKELQELLEKAELMREQQRTQVYDVTEHYYQFYKKIDNWAEYYGPAEPQEIPGKGKGLVATRDIPQGQLVFACRAFAIEFHDPEKKPEELEDNLVDDDAVKKLHDIGGCWLVQRIYDRLKEVPELGREVYQLFAGPELGRLDPNTDNTSILDINRISGIVRYNCFANSDDDTDTERSSGLWIIPSYCNHTCTGQNCTWRIYGNFILIRAFQPIKKGEELQISYASPTWAYKTRQGLFNDRLGFRCDCQLCLLDRSLAPEMITLREKLQKIALKQQVEFVGLSPEEDPEEIFKKFQESRSLLQEIIGRLKEMHPSHGPLNVLLIDPLQQLGMKYFGVGDFEKAAQCMQEAHEIMLAVGVPHGACECMLWVVGSYLQLGNIKVAKRWIQVLKRDAMLAHGTLKVLHMMGDWVVNAMKEHNIPL